MLKNVLYSPFRSIFQNRISRRIVICYLLFFVFWIFPDSVGQPHGLLILFIAIGLFVILTWVVGLLMLLGPECPTCHVRDSYKKETRYIMHGIVEDVCRRCGAIIGSKEVW